MQAGQYLRGTFFGSWLIAAGAAAQAEEAVPNNTPALYGSPATIARLAPIRDAFMRLTQINTLVITRGDLFTPAEEHQMENYRRRGQRAYKAVPLATSLKRLNEFFKNYKDILPFSVDEKTADINMRPAKSMEILIALLAEQAPMAKIGMNKKSKKEFCEVIVPEPKGSAQNFFLSSAEIEKNKLFVRHAHKFKYEDIYHFVALHEATHCNHPFSESPDLIKFKLDILEKEVDADERAHEALGEHLKDKRSEEYRTGLRQFIEGARAIGALRNGFDFFSGKDDFPTHVTYVYPEGYNPGFEFNAADVALAVKLTGTVVNIFTGLSYAPEMIQKDDPGLRKKMKKAFMTAGDAHPGSPLVGNFMTTMQLGQWINQDNIALQYGMLRATRDLMRKFVDNTGTADASSGKIMKLSLRLLENYTDAVQTYLPTLARDPQARKVYEKAAHNIETLMRSALADGGTAPVVDMNSPNGSPVIAGDSYLLLKRLDALKASSGLKP